MNIETIQITQELLILLSEIDEFKGAWRCRMGKHCRSVRSPKGGGGQVLNFKLKLKI